MGKLKLSRKFLLLVTMFTITISYIFYNVGYIFGWQNGENEGFKSTTDIVISILNKQLKSDTTVTKLIIVNPDTNIYYLTRKSILNN